MGLDNMNNQEWLKEKDWGLIELEIVPMLKYLLRHAVFMVAAAFILGAGTAMIARAVTPATYLSTFQAYIDITEGDLAKTMDGRKMNANDFKSMFNGEEVIQSAINENKLDPALAEDSTAAVAIKSSGILRFTVISTTPDNAYRLAQGIEKTISEQVDVLMDTCKFNQLERPTLPTEPRDRKIPQKGMTGAAAGFALTGLFFLLRFLFRDVVHTEDSLYSRYGLKTIGRVRKHKKSESDEQEKLDYQEAFATLRTNLSYMNTENKPLCIGVTSAGKGDGKSTVAINLAGSVSGIGKKVILLDCNLRAPAVASGLGVEKESGLSDLLTGRAKISEAIVHDEAFGFDILTAGTADSNPSRLFDLEMMQLLIDELKKWYDMVILDLPSMTCAADSSICAKYVDGLLLVVYAEKTKHHVIERMMEQLRLIRPNVYGVVFNGHMGSRADRYA